MKAEEKRVLENFYDNAIEMLLKSLVKSTIKTWKVKIDPEMRYFTKDYRAKECPGGKEHVTSNSAIFLNRAGAVLKCYDPSCDGKIIKAGFGSEIDPELCRLLFSDVCGVREIAMSVMRGVDPGITEIRPYGNKFVADVTSLLDRRYSGVYTRHVLSPSECVLECVPKAGCVDSECVLECVPEAGCVSERVDTGCVVRMEVPEYRSSLLYRLCSVPGGCIINVVSNVSNVINVFAETVSTPRTASEDAKLSSFIALVEFLSIPEKVADALRGWLRMPTHKNLASVAAALLYGKKIVYSNGKWFIYDGVVWEEDATRTLATSIISDSLDELFSMLLRHADTVEHSKAAYRLLSSEIVKCTMSGSISGILRLGGMMFRNAGFYESLDTNRNIVAFKNGVLEIGSMRFRGHCSEDLITGVLPYDYDESVPTSVVDGFLRDLMPDAEEREYLISCIARPFVDGLINDQIFFFLGEGSNGKSVLARLIQLTFMTKIKTISPSLLTRMGRDAGAPTPELSALKNTQGMLLVEPEEKDMISSTLKRLCGGDEVTTRELYGRKQESYVFKAHCFIFANHLPRFSLNDKAIWRRIRTIYFSTVFVERPEKPHESVANPFIASSISSDVSWRQSFFNLIIRRVCQFRMPEIPRSFSVRLSTMEKHNSRFVMFLNENIVSSADGFLSIKEILRRYVVEEQLDEMQGYDVKKHTSALMTWLMHKFADNPPTYGTHRVNGMVIRGIKGISFQ